MIRLWNAFKRWLGGSAAPLAAQTPPVRSWPWGTAAAPTILEGTECVRRQMLDGRELPPLGTSEWSMTTDDWFTREGSTSGAVQLGDGSVVRELGPGLAACALCQAECAALVAQGLLDPAVAAYKSLHHSGRLAIGETGMALCPRHRRTLETRGGPKIVSTIEAEDLERQARIQTPLQLVKSWLLEQIP